METSKFVSDAKTCKHRQHGGPPKYNRMVFRKTSLFQDNRLLLIAGGVATAAGALLIVKKALK